MKRTLSIVLSIIMVMMLVTACSGKQDAPQSSTPQSSAKPAPSSSAVEPASSESAGKYDSNWKIACVYSSITGDYWGVAYNGCKAALDELKAEYGVSGYCVAPAQSGDYTQQMDLLDTVLLEKASGLVLCPSNSESIGAYVTDKFTDDSIPIIVIDRSLNSDSPAIIGSYATDAYSMSQGQFEMAKKAMADKDEVYFIHLGISPENQQWADRSYGFLDSAKNDPKFINYIEDGDGVYWVGQVTDQICVQFLQDTFNSNPDKTFLVLGTSNGYNNDAVTAVSELSKEKKENITIIGWDFSATELGLLKTGEMYGAMGQNPFKMGYDSTFMMCDYLAGDKEAAKDKTVPWIGIDITNLDSDESKEYMKSLGMNV
ncbi:MAG: sugar ABC transporter substrate-binding protein [Clostridia bacterium]|nr:sugar ABC transporter substrate-binding protein [Clostridia bacterium]